MLDIELSLWLLLDMDIVGVADEKVVVAKLEDAVVDIIELVILAVVENESLEDAVANELEFMLNQRYKILRLSKLRQHVLKVIMRDE